MVKRTYSLQKKYNYNSSRGCANELIKAIAREWNFSIDIEAFANPVLLNEPLKIGQQLVIQIEFYNKKYLLTKTLRTSSNTTIDREGRFCY
jgi:hypothetical protein